MNSYIVCFSSIGCAGALCAGGREFDSGWVLTLNFFISLFLWLCVCLDWRVKPGCEASGICFCIFACFLCAAYHVSSLNQQRNKKKNVCPRVGLILTFLVFAGKNKFCRQNQKNAEIIDVHRLEKPELQHHESREVSNMTLQWTPMKMPRFLHTSRRRSMQAARLSLHACIAEGVYYLH